LPIRLVALLLLAWLLLLAALLLATLLAGLIALLLLTRLLVRVLILVHSISFQRWPFPPEQHQRFGGWLVPRAVDFDANGTRMRTPSLLRQTNTG
jgi:hypothetical protein